MAELNCNVGTVNTGQACVPLIKVAKKLILVQTYDNTGALNELDLTAGPFNAAFFAAKFNDTDPSKRWLPLPEMKNIVNDRADSIMEGFEDGSQVFIEQGIRSFTGFIIASDAPPQMVDKIRAARGIGYSIFIIDKERNLIGKAGSSSTKLAPIELESDTVDAIFQMSQDKTIQKIKVSFNININENDAEMRMVQYQNLAYDLSNARGLIDVSAVYSNKTTTTVTVKLLTDGGDAVVPVLCKGLVIADFVSSVGGATSKIYNETDGLDVAISAFTESPAGVYNLTFLAQTAADVLVIKPLKNGYDFTAVEAETVTVP